jgi:DNA-binding transcriptional regulator YiaG
MNRQNAPRRCAHAHQTGRQRGRDGGQAACAHNAGREVEAAAAVGLTQEEFAGRYHIPIGTMRDWEQGRSEPDRDRLIKQAKNEVEPNLGEAICRHFAPLSRVESYDLQPPSRATIDAAPSVDPPSSTVVNGQLLVGTAAPRTE